MSEGKETKPTTSHIPTHDYDYHGSKIVPLNTGKFFAELLTENDGIAVADDEHLALLFRKLADDLPEMKKAGLANVYIEAGRDNQANVDKFLETGNNAYLHHFTDDVSHTSLKTGSRNGIPISFLDTCRNNGLRVICYDISDDKHAEELDTIPLNFAGDQKRRQKVFEERTQEVGKDQAIKEREQVLELRRQHNEDWMRIFKEEQSKPTAGKFLFIGGSGHFQSNMGKADGRDIDEMIAELGYKAPHVNVELHDGFESYIEKPSAIRKGDNDLQDFRVFYNKEQAGAIPHWTRELMQSQLDTGKLDYHAYQQRLAMFAAHNHKLLTGIEAAEKIFVVPESDTWKKLPDDHPMKSPEHVEKAQQLFNKLMSLKTAIKEDKADYGQAEKLFDELLSQSRTYIADAGKLKTYYEAHIQANPQSNFDQSIFNHLNNLLTSDDTFAQAGSSSFLLASYKTDFDNQKKANATDTSMMHDVTKLGKSLLASNVQQVTGQNAAVAGVIAHKPVLQQR